MQDVHATSHITQLFVVLRPCMDFSNIVHYCGQCTIVVGLFFFKSQCLVRRSCSDTESHGQLQLCLGNINNELITVKSFQFYGYCPEMPFFYSPAGVFSMTTNE